MPCRSDFPEDTCSRDRSYDFQQLLSQADAATRAACDLRTILRRGGTENDLALETRNWIKGHDEWDARRIAQEEAEGTRQKVKQAALDKLTLDERRVLGL